MSEFTRRRYRLHLKRLYAVRHFGLRRIVSWRPRALNKNVPRQIPGYFRGADSPMLANYFPPNRGLASAEGMVTVVGGDEGVFGEPLISLKRVPRMNVGGSDARAEQAPFKVRL